MSRQSQQHYYCMGFMSKDGENPHNPKSPSDREKYYLFNAGVVDRMNGYEYDNKAFL